LDINSLFDEWFNNNYDRIIKNVSDYISIDTVTPNEDSAFEFLHNYLDDINFDISKQSFNDKLEEHELFTPYSYPKETKRYNYIASPKKPNNSLPKTIFNIHTDVVPPSSNNQNAFKPFISEGYIYGRGSCDTKTNLIALVEAIRFMINNNIPIKRNIEIHLPVEEEVSGNGTLSIVLNGVKADEIIVMEPTELILFAGHRGCITARINTLGNPVHMGGQTKEMSAINIALEVIEKLKELENNLLLEAKENKEFSCWNKPLKVNVGIIKGGEWPGSIPEKCEITCNVGFLTNHSLNDMKNIINEYCINKMDKDKQKYISVTFDGLKNDAYYCNNNTKLVEAVKNQGIQQPENPFGWIVSCDASIYYDLLNIPTYIWGCGSLADAHSSHERVEIEQIKKEILSLIEYLSNN